MRGLANVVLAGLVSAGCGPVRAAAELPEPPPRAIDAAPYLVAGEQTTWNVFFEAVPIGRAALAIHDGGARAELRTTQLARALVELEVELETAWSRDRTAEHTRERLAIGRAVERAEARITGPGYETAGARFAVPGGTRLHSVPTALGAIRAWSARARAGDGAGYLWLWSGGRLYRLDVAAPVRDDVLGVRALRLDGTLRGPHLGAPIALAAWLAANGDRTPIRFAFRIDGRRVSAEVHESNAALE